MTLNFLKSDRIDNLNEAQAAILKEMMLVVGVDPEKCLLTDMSQMSDFMWEMPGSSLCVAESYQIAFERQFDRLCDAMYAKFGIPLIDENGNQRTIVDYIDVVIEKTAELLEKQKELLVKLDEAHFLVDRFGDQVKALGERLKEIDGGQLG